MKRKSGVYYEETESECSSGKSNEKVTSSLSKIQLRISTQGKGIKMWRLKEMLQKLSITLANVKADKTFENLQNEIYHIIYSLYLSKNITKKVVELSDLRIKITQKHKKNKK